jgi:hypothetical protein
MVMRLSRRSEQHGRRAPDARATVQSCQLEL